MANTLSPLSALRINGLMKGLQDVRLIPSTLTWLGRTVVNDATDDEILGRFLGHIQIADIVADDSEAAVYSAGKLSFETYKIPNLKHGQALTQEQINQLRKLAMNPIPGDDFNLTMNMERGILDNLLLGVRQRMEALIIAMLTDTFTYDRLGVKIVGTFGMPADLKVTTGVSWTDPVNATPVGDVLALLLVGRVRYGIVFNRMSLSTAAFRAAVATAEFQAKARMYLAPNVSFTNISQYSLKELMGLWESVTGVAVELNDSRYWQQQTDGTLLSYPFQSVGTVIMTDSGMDNNANAWDFANGEVTETTVSSMIPTGVIGGFAKPQRGPVAYAAPANSNLNPPGINYWGVARGLSRRKMLQCSGILNVGAVVDPIPITEPAII